MFERVEIVNYESRYNIDFYVYFKTCGEEEYRLFIQPAFNEENGEIISLHTPDSQDDYDLLPYAVCENEIIEAMYDAIKRWERDE